jgi:putative membrane protein
MIPLAAGNGTSTPMGFDGLAYCGPPPLPETLWGRWNFDPLLIAMLGLALAAYLVTARGTLRQHLAFAAGWAVVATLFVSPLCALTVALLSARVGHHLLLVAVAAPLLAIGLAPALRQRIAAGTTVLLIIHAGLFWLWHIPDLYDLALRSAPVYWAMQLSLLASAVAFWGAVLAPSARPTGAIAALVAATIQMGLLGALLTFAPQALYAGHLSTTEPFALTPLMDQQLAGLLMWVPGALPYALGGLALMLRHVLPDPRREAAG